MVTVFDNMECWVQFNTKKTTLYRDNSKDLGYYSVSL